MERHDAPCICGADYRDLDYYRDQAEDRLIELASIPDPAALITAAFSTGLLKPQAVYGD